LEVKGSSVQFLHQTARDFLLTSEMSDYLSEKAKPRFPASLSVLRAFVAIQKHISHPESDLQNFMPLGLLQDALQYASDALEDSLVPTTDLLDDLESLFRPPLEGNKILPGLQLISQSDAIGPHANFYNESPDFLFRRKLLRAGASQYVCRKLKESPHYFDDLNESPLGVVFNLPELAPGQVQMVSDLLASGQNPENRPVADFIRRTYDGQQATERFHAAVGRGLFSCYVVTVGR
jgi:hypothetical protein